MKTIPILNLLVMLLPIAVVGFLLWKWCGRRYEAAYATVRMTAQLLAIGYVLAYIFEAGNQWIGFIVLAVMMGVSSWIAIRPIKQDRRKSHLFALASIGVCGTVMLFLVCKAVLMLKPWYQPQITIPLAGMIYSNCMNMVSLAGERYEKERGHGLNYTEARGAAFNAALIPQINTFLAVGLVSLPGMMTGQILSGVSPLIAVRYQIMVMCMILGAGGLAAAGYLQLKKVPDPAT